MRVDHLAFYIFLFFSRLADFELQAAGAVATVLILLVIACSSLSFKPMGLLSYACIFLGSVLTALNASPAVCTLGFLQVAGLVVCLFAGQTDPCPVVIALTLGMGRGGRVHGLLAQAQGTGGIGAQTLKTLTCGCASESLPKAWQLHHPSW